MKAFNLNSNIYVRLNIRGYQRLADLHNIFIGHIPNWDRRIAEYYERQCDAYGYTKFQAWDFIEKFGEVTGLTMSAHYYTTILIDEKDLTDYNELYKVGK